MTNEILMLPPQVTVGQQVIQVQGDESASGELTVRPWPAHYKRWTEAPGTQFATRSFRAAELFAVLGWIESEAQRIGANMAKAEKSRLRRQGYNV